MLVLSRKVGQEILIGADISIYVLAVHGNRVRVGIAAPQAVAIRRREIPPLFNSLPEPAGVNDTAARSRHSGGDET